MNNVHYLSFDFEFDFDFLHIQTNDSKRVGCTRLPRPHQSFFELFTSARRFVSHFLPPAQQLDFF